MTFVALQREVVMPKVGWQQQLFAVRKSELGKEVHNPDMVSGKASQIFFFRVEKFHAAPVVRQPKANKTVVNESMPVGGKSKENLNGLKIRRIIDRRQWRLFFLGVPPLLVKLEDQKGFIGEARPGKGFKYFDDFCGTGHGGETKSAAGIVQGRKIVALANVRTMKADFAWPGPQPTGEFEWKFPQDVDSLVPTSMAQCRSPQGKRFGKSCQLWPI